MALRLGAGARENTGARVGRGLTYSSANLFLVFSNTRLKGEPFLQTGFQERGYSYLGYASPGTQKPKMDFLNR